MNTVEQLQGELTHLVAQLSPQARKKLARAIAVELVRSQRARIGAQQNPDESSYVPRKPRRSMSKKGRVKAKAMFMKLKTARFLKTKHSEHTSTVGFNGLSTPIARVHQYGLEATVDKKKFHKVKYAKRELLGFSPQEIQLVEELIISQLAL